MRSFDNKVVWVTGASSGIGEALIAPLIEKGAHVIISARRESELNRVRQQFPDRLDRILVLPLDLSRHETLSAVVQDAIAWHGHIDMLINNGGVSQRALCTETTLDVEKNLFDVNYFGTVELTRLVLPHMMVRKQGHINVVSSVVGKVGIPMRSTYSATKHALHGYFDALRAEVYPYGISVSIVTPGYISTQVSVNALRADGTTHSRMDRTTAKGMSAAEFAVRMIRSLENGREEFAIGGPEIYSILIKRFFPRLASYLVRRYAPSKPTI
jgi:short-subunit dehydrogenase